MNIGNTLDIMDTILDDDEETAQKLTNQFVIDKILGEGSFGIVASAHKKDDPRGRKYAIKIIKKSSMHEHDHERFLQEAHILSNLQHPNIVLLHECIQTKIRMVLVMELIEGGTLMKLMEERFARNQVFTEEETSMFMRSLLEAVKYMHSKNVVHRDLKPENILIQNKNDLSTIKIVDFGISAQFDKSGGGTSMTERCGTLLYMAPELIFEKLYNKPVDVWACGIMMYMMLTGKHPFYPNIDTSENFLKRMKNPQWTFPANSFSEYAKNLFLKLVDNNHLNRYTADIAANHPWITRKFNEDIPLSGYEYLENIHNEQKLAYIMGAIYFLSYAQNKCNAIENIVHISQVSPSRKLGRKDTYKKLVQKFSETREKDRQTNKKLTTNVWNSNNYTEILFDIYGPQQPFLKKSKSKIVHDDDKNMKSSQINQSKKLLRTATKVLYDDDNQSTANSPTNNIDDTNNHIFRLVRQSTRKFTNKINNGDDNRNQIQSLQSNYVNPISPRQQPTNVKVKDESVGFKYRIKSSTKPSMPISRKMSNSGQVNNNKNNKDRVENEKKIKKDIQPIEIENNYGLYSPTAKKKTFKIETKPIKEAGPNQSFIVKRREELSTLESERDALKKISQGSVLYSPQSTLMRTPVVMDSSLGKSNNIANLQTMSSINNKRVSTHNMTPLSRAEYKKTLSSLNRMSLLSASKGDTEDQVPKPTPKTTDIPLAGEEFFTSPRYLKVTKTALQKVNFKFYSDTPSSVTKFGRKTMINYNQ